MLDGLGFEYRLRQEISLLSRNVQAAFCWIISFPGVKMAGRDWNFNSTPSVSLLGMDRDKFHFPLTLLPCRCDEQEETCSLYNIYWVCLFIRSAVIIWYREKMGDKRLGFNSFDFCLGVLHRPFGNLLYSLAHSSAISVLAFDVEFLSLLHYFTEFLNNGNIFSKPKITMARGFQIGSLLYWKNTDVEVVDAEGAALQMEKRSVRPCHR